MPAGIAGCGSMGIALETVPGTYVAPTKFFPFLEESLQRMQETVWRRAIRKSADFTGATPGNVRVEGDISMEALEDVVPYFLLCARTAVVKTGTLPNFTYEFTGVCNAIPPKTMSITVVRNGVVFGYVGCVVSSFTFTVEEGLLQFNVSMLGRDEGDQATPVEAFSVTEPFGAGQYNIELPVGSVVLDTDTFEFTVDDAAEAQYRLKNTGQGAQFVSFGERTATATVERDFENKTEYNAFKALTKRALRFTALKTANNSIVADMPAAITDTYEVGLSGQGDLVRASVAYQGAVDALGNAYKVTVKTQENITVV
jgi:hypothetical protein